MASENLFNPLDKDNLGQSVVEALLGLPAQSFDEITPFKGAGIYAIYYIGSFESYASLAASNRKSLSTPIYIGKAVPKGGRKGLENLDSANSNALLSRLNQHARSIDSAKNLNLADFKCRFLAVDDIWIPLGESLLLQKFRPLWNQVVEGFGNHDPGKGRYNGKRPVWDEIHPGRGWAKKCSAPLLTQPEIIAKIDSYFSE